MKNMYSLMLSEAVVREVDALAQRKGMTRSALVNEILAEYVSFTTPEKRINDIFGEIEKLFSLAGLVVKRVGRENTLTLRRELEFPYRPTLNYEVELYRIPSNDSFGVLRVGYRTTSIKLLTFLYAFFDAFEEVERLYGNGRKVDYETTDGCWTRTLVLPSQSADLGQEITDFVNFLDEQIKKALACGSFNGLESEYIKHKSRGKLNI